MSERKDICKVCSQRFTDVSPPGPAVREVHHVVPRAYGGTHGPLVDLCSDHHALIHRVAIMLEGDREEIKTALAGHNTKEIRVVLHYAEIVFNAKMLTKDDPNKRSQITLTLGAHHRRLVSELRKVYPKIKSQQALMLYALEQLHRRNFIR